MSLVGSEPAGVALASALVTCGHTLVARTHETEQLEAAHAQAALVDLSEAASGADLVWVSVPEEALGHTLETLADVVRPGVLVAHSSAELGMAPLAPVREAGAIGLVLAPLCPLDGLGVDVGRLAGATCAVAADAPFLPIGEALATEAGCVPLILADEQLPVAAEAYRMAALAVADAAVAAAALVRSLDESHVAALEAVAAESVHRGIAAARPTVQTSPAGRARRQAALDRLRLAPLDADDPAAPAEGGTAFSFVDAYETWADGARDAR